MKVYTASSWRNPRYDSVVAAIKQAGHEIYDFRNPPDHKAAFHWSDIDPDWKSWDSGTFRSSLSNPIARRGFESDFGGMQWADVCVLILPCGRSAHLEAGWFAGRGKPVVILLDGSEPELTYKLASKLAVNNHELLKELEELKELRELESH